MTAPSPKPSERLAFLWRIHTTLSRWAASLSWGRMAALGLIVLIAGSWIADTLQLAHQREPQINVKRMAKHPAQNGPADRECEGDEVRIGGKNGIVICEGRRSKSAKPANPAHPSNSANSANSESATPAPPSPPGTTSQDADERDDNDAEKSKDWVRIGEDEVTVEDARRAIRHTFGGWLRDIISAALIALFAYLIAAKVIVRKTAEADAKVRVAHDSAEHEAMQRQLVQARLKLLQAQVEPHFLFNTLAAVDYLIETDAKRASVMQKTLIGYLRAALPQMRQDSSTLGREVVLIQAYLELLKMRIEERLTFDIDVPPGLQSAVFPPMMLQSLVENAIKHGIEPKPEGGHITVRAQTVDGQLCVDVEDTGVGLPSGNIFGHSTQGTGLGLDNIRNRLALLYPGTSSIELRSEHSGGTLVRLQIPYQVEATTRPSAATPQQPPRTDQVPSNANP